jgi:TolA-binding protein
MRINKGCAVAFLLGAVLASAGCQKRARAAALPPLPPSPPPAVRALEQADTSFVAGNYREAAQAYENYLQLSPAGDKRDEALFRLGLMYALPEGPSQDWRRASAFLRRVVDEFPRSPLRAPASLILSLQTEVTGLAADSQRREQRIRQLSSEIETLKKIDTGRATGSRNRGGVP